MKVARRPTTAFSASITIHFFSTSAGLSAAVVFVFIEGVPEKDGERPNAAKGVLIRMRTLFVNTEAP
jgi:hypothetical protein